MRVGVHWWTANYDCNRIARSVARFTSLRLHLPPPPPLLVVQMVMVVAVAMVAVD